MNQMAAKARFVERQSEIQELWTQNKDGLFPVQRPFTSGNVINSCELKGL